ncbi:hypothetical protein TNCV_1742681 [Trichonephila clavipes]|nr:hypothetical protein TNCV_1742681 [Trichonephila clavipes]
MDSLLKKKPCKKSKISKLCNKPDTVSHKNKGIVRLRGIEVCKCKVPSWHGGSPNSHRAASPLVRLEEREERWEVSDRPRVFVLSQNWGGNEAKRTRC